MWSRLREPVWDAWWAAWAQAGDAVWEEVATHAAAVDARVGAAGEAIWQQVRGQIMEAEVDWQLGEEVRRHLREPDQDWEWRWDHERWPRLLARVARGAWLPPWELVVAPPGTGSGGWEEWHGAGWEPGEAADLDDTYWDSVERGPFEEEVRSGWYTRGQHDAGALALIDVLDRAVGLRPARPLAGQLRIGRSAGWWWPFEQVAILTERPCALDLARDEQGRLHQPTGPVVAYPDGWAVWAWHGVRVPRQVVERPDTIIVNATPDPDGSRATYLLRVPPTVSSARQAVAWTFGMSAEDYHPTVQT